MKHTVTSILEFAEKAHSVQTDHGGQPYFQHVRRVHERVRAVMADLPPGSVSPEDADDILNTASLHDVFEDSAFTGYDLEYLDGMGLRDGVVRRVKRLCGRAEGVTYIENIRQIAAEGDLGTIIVKLADNEDNSDPARIAQLPPELRSIERRYERSKTILRVALAGLTKA